MMPGDANHWGNVHGGVIMKLVDTAAGVCSIRHTRRRAVTARIDNMSFLQPVFVGDLVRLKASVNDVGRTSLEVGVRVEAEDLMTGVVRHVSSAYLVFVALDEEDRPTVVPPLIAESEIERNRMSEAKLRRNHRQRGEAAMRAMRVSATAGNPLQNWKSPLSPFALIGHRGAAGLAPENTLPSFELAVRLGADAIELDVHLSSDGVPVVIHDDTVDRTTNGHGAISAMTVKEIQSLNANGPFFDAFPMARIPTLEEVLAWARPRVRVVIELKGTNHPDLIHRTMDQVTELGMSDRVMIVSFDHVALRRVRALRPDILTGVLYNARPIDPLSLAILAEADVLCPHWSTVSRDLVEAAHASGLAVSVWTANNGTDLQFSLSAGVDAITTDFPDRIRSSELPGR